MQIGVIADTHSKMRPEALEALETLVNSTPHDNERNLVTDALARLRGEPVFRD